MIQRTSLILVAILAAGLGLAQQTENHELRAVPAPGKVVIDGKLGDWDLSGEIVCCYDLTVLKETHSVRAAAMCDAQYLYLSFRFKDPTPLVNHIDPKLEPGGGWKADAVQLRIKLDRVAHVTAWYYTDRREPAMSIHYGLFGTNDPDTKDLDDALAAGAREAFLADPDGRGYVHEMAIPWELLARDGHALKAGDHMSLGFELFWGSVKANDWPEHRYADLVNPQRPQREFFWTTPEAWGTLTFLARGKLAPSPSIKQLADVERQAAMQYSTAGPIALRYDLPADAAVTLVVEKPDGTRVRNLFGDYPRKAGRNTDYWDGADDAGHLVPPGAYRVRGLYHRPLDAFYDFAYGNPGDPPYDNSLGTGGWLSNHAPPMAVAAGRDRVYLTAAFAEGATAVLGADYEGRRQWGVGNINAGMPAEDGKYLYLLVGGPSVAWGGAPENEVAIVRLDAATGKHAPWPDGKSMHSIATIASWDQWFKPHRPEGELVATHGFDADWCQRQTLGLAVAGGKLYASLHFQNRVVVVDADKGVALAQISPRPSSRPRHRRLGRALRHLRQARRQANRLRPVDRGRPRRPIRTGRPRLRRAGQSLCLRLGRRDVRQGLLPRRPPLAHDRQARRSPAQRTLRPFRHVPPLGASPWTRAVASGSPSTTTARAALASGTPPPAASSASSAARPTTRPPAPT